MQSNLLKAEDVSRILNIPLATVYFYANNQTIPSIRIGKKIRFKKADIEKIVQGLACQVSKIS